MKELKMKHVKQLMELLNVKNASELFFYISECLKTKQCKFSELDGHMQTALLTQKKYEQDEEVTLNDHDQTRFWKFTSTCIQLTEGVSEEEADDKIDSVSKLYEIGNEFYVQIIKLQTITSPNETPTN